MTADRRRPRAAEGARAVSRVLGAAVVACALVAAGSGGVMAAGPVMGSAVADSSVAGQAVTDHAAARPATERVVGHLVVDGEVVSYSSGPYADRLCPTTSASGTACALGRSLLATVQGAGHRERAVESGATCERQEGLWVCFDVRSLLVQRGGTTYGDTFLSPGGQRTLGADLVAHESEHVRQWRLFGPDFSILYLAEGVDPCDNYFEQQAGLAAGGYSCG